MNTDAHMLQCRQRALSYFGAIGAGVGVTLLLAVLSEGLFWLLAYFFVTSLPFQDQLGSEWPVVATSYVILFLCALAGTVVVTGRVPFESAHTALLLFGATLSMFGAIVGAVLWYYFAQPDSNGLFNAVLMGAL